jgi:3-oxoacyl-[acyl-carrier protein] reductase
VKASNDGTALVPLPDETDMSKTFSLRGKRAVVTGGTRGIGAAVSQLLAECGADVCVGYRSRVAEADAMVAALQAQGVRAVAQAADLGEPGGADALVAAAVSAFGGVDIVVHSAGIWPPEEVPVHAMDDARWRRTMRENVDATFYVSRAAARAMPQGGRIVHVSSTAGQRGEAFHADYGASKGAMISFVKGQAIELARQGVTVNVVAPGWVDTEMCAEVFADGGRERIAATIPVGRVATPADVAFAVVALCFDGARHITGEVVNVNGGSVLCG